MRKDRKGIREGTPSITIRKVFGSYISPTYSKSAHPPTNFYHTFSGRFLLDNGHIGVFNLSPDRCHITITFEDKKPHAIDIFIHQKQIYQEPFFICPVCHTTHWKIYFFEDHFACGSCHKLVALAEIVNNYPSVPATLEHLLIAKLKLSELKIRKKDELYKLRKSAKYKLCLRQIRKIKRRLKEKIAGRKFESI